jgi:hypothetical protein
MTRVNTTRADLRAHVRRTPFQPFALSLENGDRVIIEHPENVAFNPKENTSERVAIVSGNLAHYTTLSAITAISLLDQGEPTL